MKPTLLQLLRGLSMWNAFERPLRSCKDSLGSIQGVFSCDIIDGPKYKSTVLKFGYILSGRFFQILWPSQNIRTLPKLQGNFSFSKTFFCLKKQLNVEQLLITPIIEAFLPNIFRLSCWFRLEIWKQVKEAIFDQGPKLFLGLNAKLKIRIFNGLQRMHSTPWLRLARLA